MNVCRESEASSFLELIHISCRDLIHSLIDRWASAIVKTSVRQSNSGRRNRRKGPREISWKGVSGTDRPGLNGAVPGVPWKTAASNQYERWTTQKTLDSDHHRNTARIWNWTASDWRPRFFCIEFVNTRRWCPVPGKMLFTGNFSLPSFLFFKFCRWIVRDLAMLPLTAMLTPNFSRAFCKKSRSISIKEIVFISCFAIYIFREFGAIPNFEHAYQLVFQALWEMRCWNIGRIKLDQVSINSVSRFYAAILRWKSMLGYRGIRTRVSRGTYGRRKSSASAAIGAPEERKHRGCSAKGYHGYLQRFNTFPESCRRVWRHNGRSHSRRSVAVWRGN